MTAAGPRLTIDCEDCAIRKLCDARDFSAAELQAVKEFKAGDVVLAAGTELIRLDSRSAHLWTLYSGHAVRYIELPDGRRQILNFLFPTDFIGLQASLLNPAEHAVTALTDVHLCVFERKRVLDLFRDAPELGYDITWVTANEQAFVDLNLVAVGKFRADQRVAYLLLSFFVRMKHLELTDRLTCELPLRQQHIADSLGLSLPYTNLALATLKKDGLIELRGGKLRILDWDAFCERAVMPPRIRTPFRFI
jgi:CRP/FNR family transcriptional regulator, anaerobic regulatory protein